MVEHHVKGACWRCGMAVRWDSKDKRADKEGSFVDSFLNYECSDKKLHQG